MVTHHLQINKVAARARGDDLSRLRNAIINFADPNYNSDRLKSKCDRGFNNTLTSRLLCPVTKLEEFDADPRTFRCGILDGRIQIKSGDWPLFLYNPDLQEDGKLKPGLLKSEVLLKARSYLLLYHGPQSVDPELQANSKSTGKQSVAAKYELTSVSTESICYAAALSAWAVKDGHYSGAEFVRSLMRQFARYPNWRKNTITWWNT
ncbi:hypothetical protein BD413DRAFT_473365 [Trametes elegans]|nr:hypothetical protein BD413DRAFT_473365 [Trametes elegans]